MVTASRARPGCSDHRYTSTARRPSNAAAWSRQRRVVSVCPAQNAASETEAPHPAPAARPRARTSAVRGSSQPRTGDHANPSGNPARCCGSNTATGPPTPPPRFEGDGQGVRAGRGRHHGSRARRGPTGSPRAGPCPSAADPPPAPSPRPCTTPARPAETADPVAHRRRLPACGAGRVGRSVAAWARTARGEASGRRSRQRAIPGNRWTAVGPDDVAAVQEVTEPRSTASHASPAMTAAVTVVVVQ